jgi:hypothetical protein
VLLSGKCWTPSASFDLINKDKFTILRWSFKTVLHIRRCPIAFDIQGFFILVYLLGVSASRTQNPMLTLTGTFNYISRDFVTLETNLLFLARPLLVTEYRTTMKVERLVNPRTSKSIYRICFPIARGVSYLMLYLRKWSIYVTENWTVFDEIAVSRAPYFLSWKFHAQLETTYWEQTHK